MSVAIADGLVLARSAFHHSINYRSVVILGSPRIVDDPDEKWRAFEVLTEHVTPGRWTDCRLPTPKEVKGTLVAAIPLNEASAKVRTGPPGDDDEDYGLPLWAGVIPLRLESGEPVPDPQLGEGIELPAYLAGYRRG